MPSLWIVHREQVTRAALARLAAAPEDALSGPPGEPPFDAAPAPDVVLLGLAGDLESELEFAHRVAPRLRGSAWILLGDAAQLEAARRLFDTLSAEFQLYPPQPHSLRGAIRAAARGRVSAPLPLSLRPARDALSERFARGFADLEPGELLRALDPRLGDVPVLILGEPGTGRGILARYIHSFGASAGGALAELPCGPELSPEQLLERLAACPDASPGRHACSVWLEDVQRLAPAVQRRLRGWIEFGLPAGTLGAAAVRWIGSGEEAGLEAELRRALGGLTLRIPALRERPGLVANLANATALAWCAARGLRPRRLGEHALAVLEEYPWPGNLRELEALIEQSLAASAADPLGPEDLVLDGEPFAPLDAGSVGTLLEEAPSRPDEDLHALPEPIPEPLTRAEAERRPDDLARLAGAVGHELRNPLTAVRTFAELLSERYAEPDFRDRFARLAGESLTRVEEVLDRLAQLASFPAPEPRSVDVGGLLQGVLEQRRKTIHERRILVLEELDRSHPHARCDPEQMRFVFEALLDKSLELVPEQGDLYLASRPHASGLRGGPSVRVLLRYRGGEPAAESPQLADVSPAANALEFAIADLLVRAQGGSLTLDTSDRNETVVVLDLPA
jgi:DNA-binding NtrC family response regulator